MEEVLKAEIRGGGGSDKRHCPRSKIEGIEGRGGGGTWGCGIVTGREIENVDKKGRELFQETHELYYFSK